MQATQLIREDHLRILELFDRLLGTIGDARRGVFEALQRALTIHAEVEERLFYASLRLGSARARDHLDRALVQHLALDDRLRRLGKLDVDDDGFDEHVAALGQELIEHIELEEGQLFVEAEALLDDEEDDRLAQGMEELTRELRGPRHRPTDPILDVGHA